MFITVHGASLQQPFTPASVAAVPQHKIVPRPAPCAPWPFPALVGHLSVCYSCSRSPVIFSTVLEASRGRGPLPVRLRLWECACWQWGADPGVPPTPSPPGPRLWWGSGSGRRAPRLRGPWGCVAAPAGTFRPAFSVTPLAAVQGAEAALQEQKQVGPAEYVHRR